MDPLADLILLIIATPCAIGFIALRWTRKGYVQTPRWLARFDETMTGALSASKPRNSDRIT